MNALVTQVWDFFSVVGQFTTKGCLRCGSECPGYASLGFLLCSGISSLWDFFSVVGQFTTKGCLRCDSECPGYASLGFLLCSGSVYRPKAACAAIVNALVTQVWHFMSVVDRFTTKGCMRCDSECPGYASLGFLVCSGSLYDQRLPALR